MASIWHRRSKFFAIYFKCREILRFFKPNLCSYNSWGLALKVVSDAIFALNEGKSVPDTGYDTLLKVAKEILLTPSILFLFPFSFHRNVCYVYVSLVGRIY